MTLLHISVPSRSKTASTPSDSAEPGEPSTRRRVGPAEALRRLRITSYLRIGSVTDGKCTSRR